MRAAGQEKGTVPAGCRSDFFWSDGCIEVRKTGVRLKVDRALVAEVTQWLLYFALLTAAGLVARGQRRRQLTMCFAPDQPRPWYLIRGAAWWAGITVLPTGSDANAIFFFDDVTVSRRVETGNTPSYNFGCTDISKSHVAAIFAEVFGYALSVDPRLVSGQMVEKSEKNGVHDGRIVNGPVGPVAGHVYQRLVDTTDANDFAQDLRTLCAGGVPVLVWVKVKPAGHRFAIHNRAAFLRQPSEIFTAAELELIRAFTLRIGLQWGGLDILRDRHSGRIYIVDVNKTDVGPVIALSWRDKFRSMQCLSRALRNMIAAPLAAKPSATELPPGLQSAMSNYEV